MRYIHLRFPGGLVKAATFSYDDGIKQDIRLAKLFYDNGIKGAFNIVGARLESGEGSYMDADTIRDNILALGHEVAVHGYNHIASGASHPVTTVREVIHTRETLESAFGGIIRGMAYPDSGIRRFDNGNDYQTVKGILSSVGIVYARTLGEENDSFRLPNDWHAWMPTAHHNNPKIFEWIDEFLALDVNTTVSAGKYPRLLKVWGHSYEFDRNNNWDRIEEICRRLGGRDDVWYATPIEIHDYVEAYNSLRFSADTYTAYNPTFTTVWLFTEGNLYSIAPGETVILKK